MPNAGHCERCGAALLSYAPEKLCPACMLQGVLDKPAGPAPSTIKIDPGTTEPEQETPDFIGGYQILEELGRGGMGVVYLAEQKEPVRRRVALKVIKMGMDTQQVIRRFEVERQALALMDHSSIAKVLDAGATENGRPYFVMELVRGLKITDYCDRHALSTEDRLNLFMQVARAVQHAHQKGVIHRDLKPSNILVTEQDGVPVPKVIDFGVAKATGQSLTPKTVFTAFEQVIGTPAYMSPEQAQLGGVEIDTRSDVYSLGVLLYELLTGRTPFDAEDLLRAGLDAMRRKIQEEEPPRPSTRLTSLTNEELSKVAKCRKAEPPNLVNLVRGDLDWIAMKALEKERDRRYDTANGLVQDVQRYLRQEAIVARPPSHLYQFGKLLRRNRRLLIAATTTTASLCLLVVLARNIWPGIQARYKDRQLKAVMANLVLHPAPWLDGEELRFDHEIDGGIVPLLETVRGGQTNGQKTWITDLDVTMSGQRYDSLVEAQADNLRPIRSHVQMWGAFFDTTYRSNHAEIRRSNAAELSQIPLEGPLFDFQTFDYLMRRLPLQQGFKMTLRFMNPSDPSIFNLEVEVTGLETITVPAGTFQCFKLITHDGNTYWYSTDPRRYLVQHELQGKFDKLTSVRPSASAK